MTTLDEMIAVLEDRIPYADPEVDAIIAKLRAAEELAKLYQKHYNHAAAMGNCLVFSREIADRIDLLATNYHNAGKGE